MSSDSISTQIFGKRNIDPKIKISDLTKLQFVSFCYFKKIPRDMSSGDYSHM